MGDFFGMWFMAIAAFVFYFLPTIVGRNKHNAISIGVLNLFLGWTLVGWVVALVWAVSNEPQPVVVQQNIESPKGSLTEELEKLAQLKEKGILTDSEFEEQKRKILNAA